MSGPARHQVSLSLPFMTLGALQLEARRVRSIVAAVAGDADSLVLRARRMHLLESHRFGSNRTDVARGTWIMADLGRAKCDAKGRRGRAFDLHVEFGHGRGTDTAKGRIDPTVDCARSLRRQSVRICLADGLGLVRWLYLVPFPGVSLVWPPRPARPDRFRLLERPAARL